VPDRQPDQSRSRRSGNPAVRAGAVPPSPARAAVERRSMPVLLRLNAVPRWLLLVLVLVLAVAGLLLPGLLGAALLLVVFALAAWLLLLSWPVLGSGARSARILILVLIAVDAGIKIAGQA
jgi:uncharacterized membrane protein